MNCIERNNKIHTLLENSGFIRCFIHQKLYMCILAALKEMDNLYSYEHIIIDQLVVLVGHFIKRLKPIMIKRTTLYMFLFIIAKKMKKEEVVQLLFHMIKV